MKYAYGLMVVFSLLIGASQLVSCKKYLEPVFIQTPVSTTAWQTNRDVAVEVSAAYSLFRKSLKVGLYNTLFAGGDVRAGDFYNNFEDDGKLSLNTLDILEPRLSQWEGYYRTIAQTNLILEKIPTLQITWIEAEKKRYKGEAFFLRGLTFFIMQRFYREFPINLTSINIDTLSRAPESEVVKQVYADLDSAIAYLDWRYPEKPVRATKGAAMAIMAHAKAWMHDYQSCANYCDSIIKFGDYRLVSEPSNFKTIFSGGSSEGIFELFFSLEKKELAGNGSPAYTTMYAPYYGYRGFGFYSDADYYVLSPPKNIRKDIFPSPELDSRFFTWFLPGRWRNRNAWFGKFRWLKNGNEVHTYNDIKGDAGNSIDNKNVNESNTIITRLADIKLLYAEALAELGRELEAAKQLNDIRKRAKVSEYVLSTGDIKDTILAERRTELIGEGHRFFDLVRTRKMLKFKDLTNIFDVDWFENNSWTAPINRKYIIESNNKLVQYLTWQ